MEPSIRILSVGPGLDVKGGVTSVERLIVEHAHESFDIIHIATMEDGTSFKKILVFLKSLFIILYSFIFRRIKLVHIHFSSNGSTFRKVIIMWLCILFRKKYILHAHGGGFPDFYTRLPRLIKIVIQKSLVRCYKLIVLSDMWADYYQDILTLDRGDLIVLPNPVKIPEDDVERSHDDTLSILFLGKVCKEKGVYELVRVFAALTEECSSEIKLIIAGNGELEILRNLLKELNITDKVIVKGWVDSSERDQLLRDATCFVLPSYFEGLPMALLEAMAYELPVIATRVGGIPEIIVDGENGILIEPRQEIELKIALSKLLSSKEIRHKLGVMAKESIKKLDVNHYIDMLQEVYRAANKGSLAFGRSNNELSAGE